MYDLEVIWRFEHTYRYFRCYNDISAACKTALQIINTGAASNARVLDETGEIVASGNKLYEYSNTTQDDNRNNTEIH